MKTPMNTLQKHHGTPFFTTAILFTLTSCGGSPNTAAPTINVSSTTQTSETSQPPSNTVTPTKTTQVAPNSNSGGRKDVTPVKTLKSTPAKKKEDPTPSATSTTTVQPRIMVKKTKQQKPVKIVTTRTITVTKTFTRPPTSTVVSPQKSVQRIEDRKKTITTQPRRTASKAMKSSISIPAPANASKARVAATQPAGSPDGGYREVVAGVLQSPNVVPCGGVWSYPSITGGSYYARELSCSGSLKYFTLQVGAEISLVDSKEVNKTCRYVGSLDLNYSRNTAADVKWLGNTIIQICKPVASGVTDGDVRLFNFNCS